MFFLLETLGNGCAFPRAGNPLGFPSMKPLFFLFKKEKGFFAAGEV